jgi:hypothetical protein
MKISGNQLNRRLKLALPAAGGAGLAHSIRQPHCCTRQGHAAQWWLLDSVQITMPPYTERFPVGTRVRVTTRQTLEEFRADWRFHNPLTSAQLECAGQEATVKEVGFYHGGDPLYVLIGLPGVWHEPCLSDNSGNAV